MNTEYYINKCKEKANYHHMNGRRALDWDSFLSTNAMVLTGVQGLCMTILLAVDATNLATTITGAGFAFVLGISNKIKDSFSFKALSYQHFNLSDDYARLYYLLSNDPESVINPYEKFTAIEERSHIPKVRKCFKILCCNEEIEIIS